MFLIQQAIVELGWNFYLPLIGIIVLIAFGIPVWVALGLGSIALLEFTGALPLSLLGEALFDGIDAFALLAIPLFILTGDILVRTQLSEKLLDVAESTVGGLRAGLGTATVLGCGFFACISGSDAAGAAAVGRMTIGRLVKQGYPKPYACALVAAGACTGILIPPSIAYIIIGLILGISASTLFLAAVIPGLMIMFSILITNLIVNFICHYENNDRKFSFSHWAKTVVYGLDALSVPFIILGGIYSGVFTPTEAGVIAVITTFIIGFIKKKVKLSDIPKILTSSAKITGVILPIIAMSLPFAQTLAILQVPQAVVQSLTSLTDNHSILLLIMIFVLILSGLVMETTPNIVILSPILLPLALEIGMNEIHFCILMVTSLGVGFITPPFGLNLFVISGLTGTSVLKIAYRAIPYVLAMLVVVLLIAFFPELSLWAIKTP